MRKPVATAFTNPGGNLTQKNNWFAQAIATNVADNDAYSTCEWSQNDSYTGARKSDNRESSA